MHNPTLILTGHLEENARVGRFGGSIVAEVFLVGILVLGFPSALAAKGESNSGTACQERIPAYLRRVETQKDSRGFQVFNDTRGGRVVSVRCDRDSGNVENLQATLLKSVGPTVFDKDRIYYDLNVSGVVTRTYIIQRKNHLLHVSIVGKDALGGLGDVTALISEIAPPLK